MRQARNQPIRIEMTPTRAEVTCIHPRRGGFTLIELLIAIGILTMTVALGMMARAVEISYEYNEGYGVAAQHARVALDRITKAVCGATHSSDYPGAWVTQDTLGSFTFPDTLVIWQPPSGTPVNSAGPPLANELLLICPDPSAANALVEITAPSDARTMPSPTTDAASFKTFIDSIKTESGIQKTQLTNLMRTAVPSGGATRGCLRFVATYNPTDAEISSYKAGTTTWSNLPWAQGFSSPNAGMRQIWIRTELQMMPPGVSLVTNASAKHTVPFFGSAAYYCKVKP
jgi:prepilin-type N-terminal cleavage/methylation domain-containing protein